MNSDFNKSPDSNATRCDLCGQRQKSVRPRRVITIGRNSGTVRTKFCDQCAAVVKGWLGGEHTTQSPPENTITVATNDPLTPAQAADITHCLVESEADRDLVRMVEKYEAIEKQSGKRVQVCIADYDETTYNFLHLGAEWTHGFWRMVNYATARKLREVGFHARFVSFELGDYMAWLARENLHDSSTARAQFAAAKADLEMEIKSAVPAVPISELRKETPTPQASAKPRGETPTPQAKADMSCKRDRWTRLTKTIVIPVAVVSLAGFVGGYKIHAPNRPADIAVARSPEVRRAIPVEIRRAIPVEPEIRKAIPVHTEQPRAGWTSPQNPLDRAGFQAQQGPTMDGRPANARLTGYARFPAQAAAPSIAKSSGSGTPRVTLLPLRGTPLVAENGSYYLQPNVYGVRKDVYARGYFRKDGTYVRSHYRSHPHKY